MVLEQVKSQFAGQEDTGFYKSVINDIENAYDDIINKDNINNSVMLYSNNTYRIPNGGVFIREDRYMKAIDTYIPYKDIDHFLNRKSIIKI